jgi:hypothetical protein
MTSREQTPTDAQLDSLEERLRGLAARQDPPPDTLLAQASLALAMRDLDSELAALVADSFDDQLVGVRDLGATRLLTFEAPGLIIELQVSRAGDHRSLVGALAGDADYRLRFEHPSGSVDVTPDRHGRFRVDDVPPGPLRVALEVAGGRSVCTAWVVV